MADHYAKYHRLCGDLFNALSACRHNDKWYSMDFPKLGEVSYCADCETASRHLDKPIREAYKAARKADLDAQARCEVETCSRRGVTLVGHSKTLLCGAHSNRAKAYHAKTAGPFWMPAPADTKSTVLKWATS